MGYRKYDRNAAKFDRQVGAVIKIAKRAHKAYQREARRQEAEKQRQIREQQRFYAKCAREAEADRRRRIREQERYEREQARLAKEQEKLQKQLAFEEEVKSIIEENNIWTSLHKDVMGLVTEEDLNRAIKDAEYEKSHEETNTLFEEKMAQKTTYMQMAMYQAKSRFEIEPIEQELQKKQMAEMKMVYNHVEPTEDSVREDLFDEAKQTIKAFWPWKKKRLVNEYVEEHITERYATVHGTWATGKAEFDVQLAAIQNEISQMEKELRDLKQKKEDFVKNKFEELYNRDLAKWREKREKFFEDYLANLHGLLNGEQQCVDDSFEETFADDDLPISYYVEAMYDETTGLVRADVDLPEIEDVPQRKITLTSTGKQSIRNKGVRDLNEDYVQCVCGLAIRIAEDIFNISPKIKNVEVSGFTQRQDPNTSLITDQYVYLINFDRETFDKIYFNKLSALQVFSFFKHHANVTKSMVMKEIDMNTAFDKLQQHSPVDYDEFIQQHPVFAMR